MGKSWRAWWAQGRTQAFPLGRWEPWRAVGRETSSVPVGEDCWGVISLGRLVLYVDFSLFLWPWDGGCVLSCLWGHNRSVYLLQIPSGWLQGAGWRWGEFRGWFVLTHPHLLKVGVVLSAAARHWPSSPPEEVASGLAGVLLKCGNPHRPPCPPNNPQELGLLLLSCFKQKARPWEASWRRWRCPSSSGR